jgi:response regulator of citrate/malate metabolism
MRDVLVVDDDFMVAEIHRRFVEQVDGFRTVGVARTGAEALSVARELQPQLILLDVYLPDMTGLEVLQRLRSDGDRVGVIMITAARELDTVSGALDGGAADYLIKPFEFPQLLAKLEAFAARADALASATGADQTLIDSLFGSPGGSSGPTPGILCRRASVPARDSWYWMQCVPRAKCRRRNALS